MSSLVTRSRTGAGAGTLAVLELGTNSLKLHLYREALGRFEPFRVEWDLGFEVYSSRRLSEQTIQRSLSQIQALLASQGADPAHHPVFGIATGAFREAENTSLLLDRLDELGIPVMVLKVKEEASLLIEGARNLVKQRPGMAFDLGGGSLELVYLGINGSWLCEDLPLGAIRIHRMASLASGVLDEKEARRWIRTALKKARVFHLPEIHGTGGTMKALAQVAGTKTIERAKVRRIEDSVRRSGAPPELSERRREIFLPGLMVVRRLMDHVGAERLHYTRVDLGEILLSRLEPFLGALRGPIRRSFLLQHLDIFRPEEGRLPASGTSRAPTKAAR
jgi:exopolyphosphatase/guanosine-5'-triphosphate,3'-diphosphate pyrophosphatase